MRKKISFIIFLVLISLMICPAGLKNANAQDDEMEKIKRRIEETKARHYQRRGGVHAGTMYIYNANKKVKTTAEGGVSVFKTKIDEKTLRKKKNIQVQHYIENVKIKERGVFKKNPHLKKKEIYTRDIKKLDPRVRKVIIIDKNIKVDIRNRSK